MKEEKMIAQYIQKLPAEIQPTIEYLRSVLLSIDDQIAEHIKWSSLAFYYTGAMKSFDPKEYKRDILVINLRKDQIMCVLPTGSNIKANIELLKGNYTDGRRMIYFNDMEDIKLNEEKFRETLKEWLSLIEK